MALDTNSPVPLYFQLHRILAEKITQGTYQPGDMMPTEQQLQEIYDVSRTTVRQAMQALETEGRVTRYRGRGTFVSRPKIRHTPTEAPTLTDRFIEQGIPAGWRLISAEWLIPSSAVQSKLELDSSEEVFRLRRLRLENNVPIGYHIAYVSPKFSDAIDDSAFSSGGSLRYLNAGEALVGSTADRILEAVAANNEEAELLDVELNTPMLLIRRTVRSVNGKPIEYFKGIYRGDRFEYHINNMHAVNKINE
jgi:GntR family transcriptional regulator